MPSNSRKAVQTQDIVKLIDAFRAFCISDCSLIEQERKPLVSHHDKTIRFTNSTTSVLKPFLDEVVPTPGVFLIQPAIGQQGRIAWQKDRILGPYASYFYSLGTLQPPEFLRISALEGYNFIRDYLQVDPKNIAVKIYAQDEELVKAFTSQPINTLISGDPARINDYRHRYGMENVFGRNANYSIYDNSGVLKEVGNLTLIEREGVPIAVEVSYDTTTLLSAVINLEHPILALSASTTLSDANALSQGRITNEELVFSDSLNVSMALILDGLEPSSRGRGRNLRDFISITGEYIQKNKVSRVLALEWANAVSRDEKIVYQALSKDAKTSKAIADNTAAHLLVKEIGRMYPEWK